MVLGVSLLNSKYIDQTDERPIYWCSTYLEHITQEEIAAMNRKRELFHDKWIGDMRQWKNVIYTKHHNRERVLVKKFPDLPLIYSDDIVEGDKQ